MHLRISGYIEQWWDHFEMPQGGGPGPGSIVRTCERRVGRL